MPLAPHLKLVFWDFDGVIKDSVEVKTNAFVELFETFGETVAQRVREHHELNGGMSRFEKIPLYLEWAGQSSRPEDVEAYCARFAALALNRVCDAPWVPGAEELLRRNACRVPFVLVTATPQDEIEQILAALDLRSCFVAVHGAPTSKREAIRATLAVHHLEPRYCLMIGDASADLEAARANGVPFLLRRHATNVRVFEDYSGDSIEDFRDS